jgi:hypothetical protein
LSINQQKTTSATTKPDAAFPSPSMTPFQAELWVKADQRKLNSVAVQLMKMRSGLI